ncbi:MULTISPECIES: ZinT family metal-binding protein [Enterococcus]|uniref:ZinT family metal-binding protein n=1 Tax=Enterococcus TaxID=1350 RepID=UPI00112994E9|nr:MULTISPECIES: ZinT/AdcA family metal-binding protein [Enterococcus]MBE9908894.1 metal-binding protein ZinT [Enterococcus casseliflavus]TPR57405.1 metal-binding protein ZinT [Enterococcus sp. OL5]
MGNKFGKYVVLAGAIVFLGACGNDSSSEEGVAVNSDTSVLQSNKKSEDIGKIQIEGLSDHYHTGNAIELSAILENEIDTPHWNWFTREDENAKWKKSPAQQTQDFVGEATVNGLEIKAALVNDNQEVYAESDPVKIIIDDHHGGTEEDQKIAEGYFDEDQVEDRDLSDFEGDWQSVYPYLLSGELDEVFEHKSEENGDKTPEEYKEYYATAYKTEIERMVIDKDTVAFYEGGKETVGTYENDGFEILDKGDGKKGVRYAYKLIDGPDNLPKFILFSDHYITPHESYHYHLYAGDDRDKLTEKSSNWPTYYPADLDSNGIVDEMLAH